MAHSRECARAVALLALPVLARGGARSLVFGIYDLHGHDPASLIGAGCAGLLLALAI